MAHFNPRAREGSTREARPRYQRQPRNVHKRTTASYHNRNNELLGAFLALACCIAIVWGFSWAYQMGYAACEQYQLQGVEHHA